MKPTVKKVMIGAVAVCVVGSGIWFATKKINQGNAVSVDSVANLNVGYWGSTSSSSGMVYDAQNQSIYADGTKTITSVFVSQGQQVHAGDPLLSYDLTSLNLTVELSKLETERIANNITLAEHELSQLQKIKPDPDVVPEPEPKPEPVPVLPSAAQKDKAGAYPNVISLTEASNAIESQTFSYCLTVKDEAGNDVKPNEETKWSDQRPERAENSTLWYKLTVHYTDGSEKISEATVLTEDKKEEDLIERVGTAENPYFFRLQKNGIVYGRVINQAKNSDKPVYLVFDILDDDGALLTEWKLRSDALANCADTDGFDVMKHTAFIPAVEPDDTVTDTPEYSGYTAVQLARAIRDKKQEIQKLNLDLRKAQLKLRDDQGSLNDGIVYAKHDGIVRKASDPNNPPQDGSAFLEVVGGSGVYVNGFVSELKADIIVVGQEITAYSWNSGMNYTGKITSVDDYPTEAGYYNGEGNPNVSYYGFEAYIEEPEGLTSGSYLEISFSEDVDSNVSNIWISRAYVRKDGKQYYVMKDDGGKLVKQTVTVGRNMYGEYLEILDGITEEDYLAFPYGKNVKEGKPTTTDSNGEVMYG